MSHEMLSGIYFSEKGNGKDRAKSIFSPLIFKMEVDPEGGPHRRLIPRRLENLEEVDYTNKPARSLLSKTRLH